MQKIKEWFETFMRFYYRKKSIRFTKKNARAGIAGDRITIDWVTACIIDRQQTFRRKELLEAQAKLKEDELFLEFLKKQK